MLKAKRPIEALFPAIVAALFIPISGQTADHREAPLISLDWHISELVVLTLELSSPEHETFPEQGVVGMNLKFVGIDGTEVGTFSDEVALRGFGSFVVKDSLSNGDRQYHLFVNDSELGTLTPDSLGRVSVRVMVSVDKKGRDLRSGDDIPVSPSGMLRISATTIEASSGRTLTAKNVAANIEQAHE